MTDYKPDTCPKRSEHYTMVTCPRCGWHRTACELEGCKHPSRWIGDRPEGRCECHSWNLSYIQRAGLTACHRDFPGDFLPVEEYSAEYHRGRLDAFREALAALDGHNFHDTAHDRVRRLLNAEEARG